MSTLRAGAMNEYRNKYTYMYVFGIQKKKYFQDPKILNVRRSGCQLMLNKSLHLSHDIHVGVKRDNTISSSQ